MSCAVWTAGSKSSEVLLVHLLLHLLEHLLHPPQLRRRGGGGNNKREEVEGIRSSLRNDIVSPSASPLRKGPAALHFSAFGAPSRQIVIILCFFFFCPPHVLTSSSFFLMRVSVSTSGEPSGSRGMGLSTRFSAFILLRDVRGINKESGEGKCCCWGCRR